MGHLDQVHFQTAPKPSASAFIHQPQSAILFPRDWVSLCTLDWPGACRAGWPWTHKRWDSRCVPPYPFKDQHFLKGRRSLCVTSQPWSLVLPPPICLTMNIFEAWTTQNEKWTRKFMLMKTPCLFWTGLQVEARTTQCLFLCLDSSHFLPNDFLL